MVRRRGRGEGSITVRPDGRWMARVDLGWQDGKRRYKALYGRTRREVAGKLTKALRDLQQGRVPLDERETVGRFLDRWLMHKRETLRPRAWLTYEQAVRLHLSPGVGKVKLAQLSPTQVAQWFQKHQQDGTSARNIRYARTVLRAALNQARKWRLVVDNVAALVDPPRHRAREIQPLTPEQARKLLESAKNHRLSTLISVATALGLRLGEALALRWQDIDFDACTLSVSQALERSGGDVVTRRPLLESRRELRKRIKATAKRSAERRELHQQLTELRRQWRTVRTELRFTEPKSARSRRTIRMPQVVVAALKSHRTRQLEERLLMGGSWQELGLVFTTPIGTPLDPRNATREFPGLLRAAGVPFVRFHDLRHTAATLLLAQGVDPRTIMETIGHSTTVKAVSIIGLSDERFSYAQLSSSFLDRLCVRPRRLHNVSTNQEDSRAFRSTSEECAPKRKACRINGCDHNLHTVNQLLKRQFYSSIPSGLTRFLSKIGKLRSDNHRATHYLTHSPLQRFHSRFKSSELPLRPPNV